MRFLIATATLLLGVCSAHAGFAGFETGNGVATTGGVVRVNFMADKAHNIIVPPGVRLGLMEVQLTFADGKTKRHTMLFAGKFALRAPLPIEWVEILGSLLLLALVCGIMVVLNSAFRLRRAEQDVPPNDDHGTGSGYLKARDGAPSAS